MLKALRDKVTAHIAELQENLELVHYKISVYSEIAQQQAEQMAETN
jgi:hypothetical protein